MNIIRKYRAMKARRRNQALREKIVLALLRSPNHTPNVDSIESIDSKRCAYTERSTPYIARCMFDLIKHTQTSWRSYKDVERYIIRKKDKNEEYSETNISDK